MNPTETNDMVSEETVDAFDSVPSEEGYSGISEDVPESTETEAVEEQVNEEVVTEKPDELQELIASDPALAEKYLAEKYGVAPQQQEQPVQEPVQQQQAQAEPVKNELPFAPEEYDPMNIQHQQALVQQTIAQALEPALDYINHLKAQEDQEYRQMQHQQIQQTETSLRNEMDKHLAGFTDLASKPNPTVEEAAVVKMAFEKFEATMRKFPSDRWNNPELQKDVLRLIAPDVKQLSSKLGIGKPKGKSKTQLQEDYVEPSSAVPAGSPNAFEKAFQAGDSDAMFDAVIDKLK